MTVGDQQLKLLAFFLDRGVNVVKDLKEAERLAGNLFRRSPSLPLIGPSDKVRNPQFVVIESNGNCLTGLV